MALSQDITLDEDAFKTASSDMNALKTRTTTLKTKMIQMYTDLATAIDTPAGHAVETVSQNVLIKPIDDMLLVIEHISSTLTEIMDTGNYKDVFIKFDELNSNIKFEN